ncbi:MAG: EAL domain-containing protein [Gammaproteobacteria bacterium]|nr:EAL domain-containing protein [Gammaproteobacteria bacterium]MBU1655513.1 EAL domain-containing protein [Gammaproteobacteria bacterium]MBU1961261.1 EAL domain-containing protein [Gammaproteobacteria bacterium]
MHPLLLSLLRETGLTEPETPPDPTQWTRLLERLGHCFNRSDDDPSLPEGSLGLSSGEMRRLYDELKASAESQLAESRDQLRSIIDSISEGLAWLDVEGRIRLLNPAGCIMLGLMEQDIADYSLFDLLGCGSPAAPAQERFEKVVQKGENWRDDNGTFHRVGLGGRPFAAFFQLNPMYAGTRIIGAVMIFRDITRQREQDARIKLWATVFQTTEEGVIITDAESVIIAVNAAFTNITGYREEEAIGRTPKFLQSGRQDAGFYQALWERLGIVGYWQGELYNQRKGGEIYPQLMCINAVRGEGGKPVYYVAVFSDISQIKRSEARLEYLAHHDPLTGLPNRPHFEELLGKAMEGRPTDPAGTGQVALMFLDVDRFKDINDSLGHHKGDLLLKNLARRLIALLDPNDVIARQGGDDFVILVTGIHAAGEVEERAGRILAALKKPVIVGGQAVFVSCSLGISIAPRDGHDPATLYKNADTALFQAKRNGGNSYVFFSEALSLRAHERFALETRLRHAMDREEFILHYQPQFRTSDKRLVGVEALIRWESPGFGLVPPGKFIPLAEETRLIDSIGVWVLNEACAQARAWRDAGFAPVRMAVNLSSHQFQSGKIVDQVRLALDQSGLDPRCLELELTESALMHEPERAMAILRDLRGLGVHLAIDDFGTGYSSLNYLKLFDVDALKIDSSFIRDIPRDKNDEHIARAVIALGRSFGLRVVAEGVETAEQIEFLLKEGCEELQGFYFSRPVPALELMNLL